MYPTAKLLWKIKLHKLIYLKLTIIKLEEEKVLFFASSCDTWRYKDAVFKTKQLLTVKEQGNLLIFDDTQKNRLATLYQH